MKPRGVIERWHGIWRAEIGDELPEAPMPLDELNSFHWAWLGSEYHRRVHETTGRQPLAHWLAEAEQLRPLPAGKDLDEVFLHRLKRQVRKDGTVRFLGDFYEVRPELVGQRVELRFDPYDPHTAPPKVFVDDVFVCDSVPLDRLNNSARRRRRQLGTPDPASPPSGLDPLRQIATEHYRRTRRPGNPDTHDAEK